jgi:hypothetical protein
MLAEWLSRRSLAFERFDHRLRFTPRRLLGDNHRTRSGEIGGKRFSIVRRRPSESRLLADASQFVIRSTSGAKSSEAFANQCRKANSQAALAKS